MAGARSHCEGDVAAERQPLNLPDPSDTRQQLGLAAVLFFAGSAIGGFAIWGIRNHYWIAIDQFRNVELRGEDAVIMATAFLVLGCGVVLYSLWMVVEWWRARSEDR